MSSRFSQDSVAVKSAVAYAVLACAAATASLAISAAGAPAADSSTGSTPSAIVEVAPSRLTLVQPVASFDGR